MSKKKTIVIVGLVLAAVITALLWFNSVYLILNGHIYARTETNVVLAGESLPEHEKLQELNDLAVLDIRAINVSSDEYERLRQALPECEILWSVPFGDGRHDNAASEVSVKTLAEADIAMLQYFPNLEIIDAQGCTDYPVLLMIAEGYPDLQIRYTVTVGTQVLREDVTEVMIADGEAEALLTALPMLSKLEAVDASECKEYATLAEMCVSYPELDVHYDVYIGDKPYSGTAETLTLADADTKELSQKLPYFPNLTEVVLTGNVPENEQIYDLMCRFPQLVFDWEFTLFGVSTRSTAKELNLSNIPMENTDAVEDALKYFYCLERVEMCECGIGSLEMDALGKRHPQIRFVWSFPIGTGTLRTDATAFIPFKVGYDINRPMRDSETWELKYCIDMECLDLGHMRMEDISFLHYMPKLKFLILADTEAENYEVVAELKELVYLELFISPFSDVELLLGLKKLEALNIGWTDLKNWELLKEMTWLKRLWVARVGATYEELKEIRDALPDTYVYIDSLHATEGGWRNFDLYREMRDRLGMFYME